MIIGYKEKVMLWFMSVSKIFMKKLVHFPI